MARLLKGIPPEFEGSGWRGVEDTAMGLIEARTTVVRQPIADSYAFYEVVKRQPLQIRWVPYMDAWKADPAWIRGLRLSDVQRQEQWDSIALNV